MDYMSIHHMKRAPHPDFSRDIAISDFCLFSYVKDQLKGKTFESADSLLDEVTEILSKIPLDTLKHVFLEWETRLLKVIDSDGEFS